MLLWYLWHLRVWWCQWFANILFWLWCWIFFSDLRYCRSVLTFGSKYFQSFLPTSNGPLDESIFLYLTDVHHFICFPLLTQFNSWFFFDIAVTRLSWGRHSFSYLFSFCWKTYICHIIQPAVHNTFWLCIVSVCDVVPSRFSSVFLSFSSFRPQSQPSQPAKATPTRGWWSSLRRRKGWASTWWAARSRTRPFTSPASSPEAWPSGTAAWSEGTSCCPSMAW